MTLSDQWGMTWLHHTSKELWHWGKRGAQRCPFINFPLITGHFSTLPALFSSIKSTSTMQRHPSSKFHRPNILSDLSASKETQKGKRKCSYDLFLLAQMLHFYYLGGLMCLFFLFESSSCLSRKPFDNWNISGIVKITRKQPWHNWLGKRFFEFTLFNSLNFTFHLLLTLWTSALEKLLIEKQWFQHHSKIIKMTFQN